MYGRVCCFSRRHKCHAGHGAVFAMPRSAYGGVRFIQHGQDYYRGKRRNMRHHRRRSNHFHRGVAEAFPEIT